MQGCLRGKMAIQDKNAVDIKKINQSCDFILAWFYV
jgi:hypothetical protein